MTTGRLRYGRWAGVLLLSLVMVLAGCERTPDDGGQGTSVDAREDVERMAGEHKDDTAEASAAVAAAPAVPVVSDRLPYAEHDDELVYGYFVFPEDMFEPLPAIIVIHEWWGLNDNVRRMADRLAGEGYIVLAVDLYGGATADDPATARQLMTAVVEDPQPAADNLQAAFEFLRETAGAPRIASLGWCFGGGWSLNAALQFGDELDAAVVYYGSVTDDEERLRALQAPLLGLFAEDDNGIPVASVHAFRDALERLRKDYIVQIYPGVGHAFANPTGQRYDAAAAEDAWRRTRDFLSLHLGSE